MTDDIAVPRDTKRTLIIVGGLVLAFNLMVAGIYATKNNTTTPDLPVGVQELFPSRDQVVLSQGQIGVQLDKTLTGELTLDGTALPLDEYEQNGLDLGTIFWKPGPNQTFSELKAGRHTITVHYWPKAQGPGGQDDRSFTWYFKSA